MDYSIEAQSLSLGLSSSTALLIPPSMMLIAEVSENTVESFNSLLAVASPIYVFSVDFGEAEISSFETGFYIQRVLQATPATLETSSPEAVFRITNGIAVISPSNLGVAAPVVQLLYKTLGSFPSLKPTTREFRMPSLPISRVRHMNYKTNRTMIANRMGRGILNMTFENISDAEAEQFFTSYTDCYGSVKPFLLPDNTLSGLTDDLKQYVNIKVTNRRLKPGDFLRMPTAVCGNGVAVEYRWLRDGVVIGGHELSYYVLSPGLDFGTNGEVTIQGMYRCANQETWTVSNPYDDRPTAAAWRWTSPPSLRSVQRGVSTVDVELQTDSTDNPSSFNLTGGGLPPSYPSLNISGGNGPIVFPPEADFQFYHELYDATYFFLPPSLIGGAGQYESANGWKAGIVYIVYTKESDLFHIASGYYRNINTGAITFVGEMYYNPVPTSTPKVRVTKARYRLSPTSAWVEFAYDGLTLLQEEYPEY